MKVTSVTPAIRMATSARAPRRIRATGPKIRRTHHATAKPFYVGASTNITTPWLVDLAGRYEDHSISAASPPVALSTRFDFNDVFAVRATVSNGLPRARPGYAEPADHQGDAHRRGIDRRRELAGGQRPWAPRALLPEKARNYSLGFTFSPTRTFHAAVDFYQIEVNDQLGRSSSIGYDFSDPANIRDPNGTPLTAAQKQTIDNLLATAGITIDQGRQLLGQLLHQHRRHADARRRVHAGIVAQHRQQQAALELCVQQGQDRCAEPGGDSAGAARPAQHHAADGKPRAGTCAIACRTTTRSSACSGTPARGTPSVNVVNNGPTKRQATADITQYEIDPTFVTSIAAGYNLGNGGSIEVGASNLFNEYPSKIPDAALTASARAIYNSQYTSSSLNRQGGQYFMRLNYKF